MMILSHPSEQYEALEVHIVCDINLVWEVMVVAPHPEPDTDITLPYYHDNGHPVWANIPVKLSSTHHHSSDSLGEE